MLAGIAGVFLFYVQHQFEDAYWETGESWDYADAALKGSSYLKLSPVMQFYTGNIGLHHVHRLSAKIPNYNLQRAREESPIFADVPVLTFGDGVRSLQLKLIDPDGGRLLTFREARELSAGPKPSAEAVGRYRGVEGRGGRNRRPAVPWADQSGKRNSGEGVGRPQRWLSPDASAAVSVTTLAGCGRARDGRVRKGCQGSVDQGARRDRHRGRESREEDAEERHPSSLLSPISPGVGITRQTLTPLSGSTRRSAFRGPVSGLQDGRKCDVPGVFLTPSSRIRPPGPH